MIVERPRWLPLTALLSTALFVGFSLNVFNGSLPIYLSHQGYSVAAIGLLVGAAFAPQLVATPLVGPLVDRRGARLAITVGSGLSVVACALYFTGTGGLLLGAARVLQGLGFALLVPASYTLVPDLVPERLRGLALGGFGAFVNVSLAVGPPLGLLLIQRAPSALFLAATGAAVVGFVASLLLPSRPPGQARARLFTYDRRWSPLYVVTFLTVVYFGVLLTFLPLHVAADRTSIVGWFFTADAVAILVFRVPAGLLTDRFGARRPLLCGIALTVLSIVLLLPAPSLWLLVIAGIGTGAGAAFLLPPVLVELGNRSDTGNRGSAMGLYSASFSAAIAVGSIAAGPLVDRVGFETALIVSAVLCAAAAPVVGMTIRRG